MEKFECVTDQRCDRCRFFKALGEMAEGRYTGGRGQCRRWAPKYPGQDESCRSSALFPIVFETRWCGEFQEQAEGQENEPLRAKTLLEIMAEQADRKPKLKNGIAEYVPENETILFRIPTGGTYEVDLDRCRTHEEALDWIFHLKEKVWVTAVVLFDFLTTLNEAFLFRYGIQVRSFFLGDKPTKKQD